ncbi:hypothetical protein DP73_17760 [Desulfosporosinus sp. HMP52]|uniref:helix-turn-helix transcriptional regulator n=1 Tax=Desulfosporosinus sp. HMP52 TaxID=1487923 RepID=UPI00051FEE87|nr:helix-turn-helix transcriptional regulator [Desulfosporosinus sp. HMP52]KGK85876.1 hypothetical protein DP73_17760 [Desulfosporosinus sp. HMP52]
MTLFQKEHVQRMRSEGKSYSKIADCLGISENTIKSYCQRNKLSSIPTTRKEDVEKESLDFCKNCGKSIQQRPGIKLRKFCSDECRTTWWKSHMDQVCKKSIYHLECAGCRKPFDSYGNKNRKYCSHACYINDRFKKQVVLEARNVR